MRRRFSLIDHNSSGKVNEDEAMPILRALAGSPEKAELAWQEMLKADANKNGKIEEDEFINYYLNVVYKDMSRAQIVNALQNDLERFEEAYARRFQQGVARDAASLAARVEKVERDAAS